MSTILEDGFKVSYESSIFDVLKDSAKLFPSNEAVYDGYRHIEYNELFREVECIASGLLQIGVKKGDKIIVCLPNWHEFVIVYFALAKIRAILIPCNPCYQKKEWDDVFGKTDIRAVFCTQNDLHIKYFINKKKENALNYIITVRFHKKGLLTFCELMNLGEGKPIQEHGIDGKEDINAILFTSGSTGVPKGVMLTHSNFIYGARNIKNKLMCNESDVFFVPVPVFHMFGLIPGILSVIMSGGKIVFTEKFHADTALKLIEKEKVTVHFGVPTMFILELNHPAFKQTDLSSLRTGLIAGSPCPEKIVKKIRLEMGCNIIVSYGATETTGGVTFTSFHDDDLYRAKTVGKVVEGTEVKIVNEDRVEVSTGTVGELACRGMGVMKGYLQMPEITKDSIDEEGWFYTGDLAKMDTQGYVYIVGRKKDMIIRGGYNIYPREIEEVYFTHPNVENVSVIGLPDTVLGEVTCAVIKIKSDKHKQTEITEETMRNFLRDKVAKCKIPDHVLFVESFPLIQSGKIDKNVLYELCKKRLENVLR